MGFDDFKFGKKLTVGFGILLGLTVILGLLAIINMRRIASKTDILVEEYLQEVTVSNHVERNFHQTMYNVRSYGYSGDADLLTNAKSYFDKVNQYVSEAQTLAKESDNLTLLKSSLDDISTELTKYQAAITQTETLIGTMADAKDAMDKSAVDFIDNCYTYLDSQNDSFDKEVGTASTAKLDERHEKISVINEIIDKGNSLRIANFKAQANRKDDDLKSAINNFSISTELSALREITYQATNIANLDKIEKSAKDYVDAVETFYDAMVANSKLAEERITLALAILKELEAIADKGIENSQDSGDDAISVISVSTFIIIFGLFIAILIGIALAYIITKAIVSGLQSGVKLTEEISTGNLTMTVDSKLVSRKDEIGDLARALQTMISKLKEIVVSIVTGAENIADASLQMASTSQEMSQGASEQASSTEEVSSSMEQMSANIQQNTENAQETQKIAITAAEGIKNGNDASQKSVASMKIIAEKIMIINEIAFQTNILALNAAVEAARAGEQGRGFAVVAAEVRKLAERSAKAASEIDQVSKTGVNIAENAGILLNQIVPEIEKTATLVQEIAAASIEQNSGASQVNSAIDQLNQVTQQNAAAAEELATSAEELASQAEQLKDIINFFNVGSAVKTSSFKKNKSSKSSIIHSFNAKQHTKKSSFDNIDEGFEKF